MKSSLGKTGSATLEKQGHTTNGRYGNDPDAQGKMGVRKGQARELQTGSAKPRA